MSIILARTAGFCYGVRRAVKIALNAAQKDDHDRLVTMGPLIHNQQAIDLLKSRGVTVIENFNEVDEKTRVLIRAHGITPEVRRKLSGLCAELCDATCPHVTAAQKIVEDHAARGFYCIIIGDKGHAEVEGLLGCASENGTVVENVNDVERIPDVPKACIVSQTTQDQEHFDKLCELVEKRIPEIVKHNTICSATSRRQKELKDISQKSDIVVVVGGRSSANTTRLVEISESMGTRTLHVETARELNLDEIQTDDVVGITAGASTPHWVIRNVVETIQNHQLGRKSLVLRLLLNALYFFIYSSILLAIGAGLLTYAAARLMNETPDPLQMLLSFFFVLSMHLINKRFSLLKDERLLYGSIKSFARYKDAFMILAVFCIILSLLTAYLLGPVVFILILLSVISGLLYSTTIFPQRVAKHLNHRRIMDIPGSKDIFMATAWGMVVVVVPYLLSARTSWTGFSFTFVFVFILAFIRSILLDMRDLEGDIALGKETIPILLGPQKSRRLIRGMHIALFLIPFLGWILGGFPFSALILLTLTPYLLFHYPLSVRRVFHQSLLYDGYLAGVFILAGAMTFLMNCVT